MFGGLQIIVVEPGTVVGKSNTGEDMIVTDTAAVRNGPKMWVTPKVYDALKAATK